MFVKSKHWFMVVLALDAFPAGAISTALDRSLSGTL